MKKLVLLGISAILLLACGVKGMPRPKSGLNIPSPQIDVSLAEDGVHIMNPSDFVLTVERAESEIGNITPPVYAVIARIPAGREFIDNETELDVRYLYRFRNYDRDYNAYSASVTRVVSYRGVVRVNDALWELSDSGICLDVDYTFSTDKVQVFINGEDKGAYADAACYDVPAVANISLLLVPYSDSGTPGIVFAADIARDLTETLLPPQNIRLLRRDAQLTLSWDAIPNAQKYKIYVAGRVIESEATIVTINADPAACVDIEISTVRDGKESPETSLEVCP